VLTAAGGIVEVQATAEDKPFTREQFDRLLELAQQGVAQLVAAQRAALGLG
jgi:ribonuclease PH